LFSRLSHTHVFVVYTVYMFISILYLLYVYLCLLCTVVYGLWEFLNLFFHQFKNLILYSSILSLMLTNDFCALNLHSSIGFLFLLIFLNPMEDIFYFSILPLSDDKWHVLLWNNKWSIGHWLVNLIISKSIETYH
jgi:hypothetical protein